MDRGRVFTHFELERLNIEVAATAQVGAAQKISEIKRRRAGVSRGPSERTPLLVGYQAQLCIVMICFLLLL